RRSVLDQWLMVAIVAEIAELVLATLIRARYDVGFYGDRLFTITASTVILVVLLAETSKIYARLARANRMLEAERDSKLMNIEAITASIGHEINQPLTSISLNASAALQFLRRVPPRLDDAKETLTDIIADSHRAAQTFDAVRSLFRRADEVRQPVDL